MHGVPAAAGAATVHGGAVLNTSALLTPACETALRTPAIRLPRATATSASGWASLRLAAPSTSPGTPLAPDS